MNLHKRIPLAKTIATGFSLLSLTTFADHYWKGGGTTSDWTDSGNWINALDNGNAVFGGAKIGDLPDGLSTVTFTNKITIGHGIWIEHDEGNARSTGVVWELGDGATDDAGITSEWGSNPSFTIGTGKGGQLTINNGNYYFPKEVWMGNGGRDSSFTLNDGHFELGSYTCIGYGAHNRTVTMTVNGGTYKQNGNNFIVSQGNSADCVGIFNQTGGEVLVNNGHFYGSENSGQSTINLSGGRLYVSKRLIVGNKGPSTLTVENGATVEWGDQMFAGAETAGTGTIVVNGGQLGKDAHLVQIGLNGTGYYTQNGGDLYCSSFRLGSDNVNAVGTANMNGGTMRMTSYLSVAGNGTGEFNLNGGSVETEYVTVGSGTGKFVLNGGTLKARQNNVVFIPESDNLSVSIGEGGAVFDTNGKNVTVADTLENADGLEGNGMIWKKGLGTLTISSDLDLERTFKFTIDTDLGEAGIGPIALTGTNNTLAAGKKITVDVRPENLITETYYPLITGLTNEITMASIKLTGDSFFVYTGKIENGTLSVSASLRQGAPAKARYVDNAWKFYDNDGNALAETEESIHTYYVFTGAEPVADLLAKASTNKIILEAAKSGGNAVTNTIAVPSDFAPTYLAVETEAGCAVVLSGDFVFTPVKFANRGTLAFDGNITANAEFTSGTISIAEGAVLHLAKSQTITAYVEGEGEMVVDDGVTLTVGATGSDETFRQGTEWFQRFDGTLTVASGATLTDLTDLHGENAGQGPYYFLGTGTTLKMAGGTISRFGGATNNENIQDVVIAEGTTNVWNNYQSRSGWTGVNINLTGSFSGTGTLQANCGGRAYRFYSDLSEFGGVVEMTGSAFEFRQPISGGTWIANPTAVLQGYLGNVRSEVAVTNATLVLKGSHELALDDKSNVISTGTYTIGADATLGVAENATVEGISFAEGAVVELLDEGALSDTTQTYVALTSATPIARPLPTLANALTTRGKWRLTVKELTEDETTVYQLVAEFRKGGLCVVIQ